MRKQIDNVNNDAQAAKENIENGNPQINDCLQKDDCTTAEEVESEDLDDVRLPGSEALQFPRWSPDGNYGVASDAQSRLWLYDMAEKKRVLLTAVGSGYPTWSRDSRFVYFQNDAASICYRVGIADRHITEIVRLAGLQLPAQALGWVGITPDGKTISAREARTRQIYALD